MRNKILGTIILVAVIGLFSYSSVKAFNAYYQTDQKQGVLASTTAVYMVGGMATTSEYTISDGIESVSYMVAIASSSTAPTLCWQNLYSNNGYDWYGSDQASSTIAHQSSDVVECWTAATTSSSIIISRGTTGDELFIGRRIIVSGLDTQYLATNFWVTAGQKVRLDIIKNIKNSVVVNKN
jgi:hypothetical protein